MLQYSFLLTPGLRSYRVQSVIDRLLIDVVLLQQSRLQQRYVALLEVDDDRAVDVLTLVRTHRHHRRQTPLTFTHRKKKRLYAFAVESLMHILRTDVIV